MEKIRENLKNESYLLHISMKVLWRVEISSSVDGFSNKLKINDILFSKSCSHRCCIEILNKVDHN